MARTKYANDPIEYFEDDDDDNEEEEIEEDEDEEEKEELLRDYRKYVLKLRSAIKKNDNAKIRSYIRELLKLAEETRTILPR